MRHDVGGSLTRRMRTPGGGRDGAETEQGASLAALAEAGRDALADTARALGVDSLELHLSATRRVSRELDVHDGTAVTTRGESRTACARVWLGDSFGAAAAPVGGREDVRDVLAAAVRSAASGARGPVPPALEPGPDVPPALPEDTASRLEALSERLRTGLPPGVVVQAAVLTQTATWRAVLRADGGCRGEAGRAEEAFVRCETARGAVVDAVAAPPGGEVDFAPLRARLEEAVAALEGPAGPPSPGLPWVLRPAVAAPLVAGLAWLLRGDVAASTPALARAAGKKPFPSLLSVEDDPRQPLGTRPRTLDDEGQPTRGLKLISEGRLAGFLHSAETAARLGAEPHGRGFREGTAPPAPSPLNLFVVPRADALPADCTELVARVETFTTMSRPGVVLLIAGGWEVRGGRRVRRIAPVELELPVMETFRALRGVGSDLTFFPTADGVGTPSLVLALTPPG
jgi:PmbA protein